MLAVDERLPISDDDTTQASIRVETDDDVVVVTVDGELDLVTAPDLNDALGTVAGERALVVDLAGVEFIDSSGLSVLVNLNRNASRSGTDLAFVAATPRVQSTFAITGLATVLPFHPDREQAIASVRRPVA